MNYWRMSFRCGTGGYEMWEKCFNEEVAAITYYPLTKIDLSKYPQFEPRQKWQKLAPAQYASLKRFVYEFKKNDIIFVKKGPYIVGKGRISGNYKFDKNSTIICPNHEPWHHCVPVKWDLVFIPIRLLLGAEQYTVYPLNYSKVELIQKAQSEEKGKVQILEGEEGAVSMAEIKFRKRNRALISAKKLNSNGCCEACGFNYQEFFKGVKKDHLVAHHKYPIGLREKPEVTKLEDIALVCSNCHTVIHSETPIISLTRLKKMVKKDI